MNLFRTPYPALNSSPTKAAPIIPRIPTPKPNLTTHLPWRYNLRSRDIPQSSEPHDAHRSIIEIKNIPINRTSGRCAQKMTSTSTSTVSMAHQSSTCATTTTTSTPTSQPTFHIHYFASAASYTGKANESLPAPLPVHKLFDVLEDKYPGIKEKVLSSCAVSVGLEYVDLDESAEGKRVIIQAGEEVAIIPPVSSG